jgi:hypothetical protein
MFKYLVPTSQKTHCVAIIVCLNQRFSNGGPQEVARCAANIMKIYFNNKFWEELIAYFP